MHPGEMVRQVFGRDAAQPALNPVPQALVIVVSRFDVIHLVQARNGVARNERPGLNAQRALKVQERRMTISADDGFASFYGILQSRRDFGARYPVEDLVDGVGLPANAIDQDRHPILAEAPPCLWLFRLAF